MSVMDTSRDTPDTIERVLRWVKLILGIVGTVGGWALGLTVWLVAMHADVSQLKRDHDDLHRQVNALDAQGTRALETIRNRQNDVLAINSSQDARTRELENKLSEIQRIQIENRFWIDQLVSLVRRESHPNFPSGRTPP